MFGSTKSVSDDIINHPNKYHIYDGISTMTNISRYDLPNPTAYKRFFGLHPLSEFPTLQSTCTYFQGKKYWNAFLKCKCFVLLIENSGEGILLQKLFWPTMRRNCSSHREFFEIQGWRPIICKIFEITRIICSNSERSEQFLVQNAFLTCSWSFVISDKLEQLEL